MIKKRNIVISFLTAVLALVCLIALLIARHFCGGLPIWLVILLPVVIFEISNIVAAKTCRCPHCGAGGAFTTKIRYSPKAMKGGIEVTCPTCGKKTKIN